MVKGREIVTPVILPLQGGGEEGDGVSDPAYSPDRFFNNFFDITTAWMLVAQPFLDLLSQVHEKVILIRLLKNAQMQGARNPEE